MWVDTHHSNFHFCHTWMINFCTMIGTGVSKHSKVTMELQVLFSSLSHPSYLSPFSLRYRNFWLAQLFRFSKHVQSFYFNVIKANSTQLQMATNFGSIVRGSTTPRTPFWDVFHRTETLFYPCLTFFIRPAGSINHSHERHGPHLIFPEKGFLGTLSRSY